MSKNGERSSLLCIAGLAVSVLSPVLCIAGVLLAVLFEESIGEVFVYIFILPSLFLPLPGLVLSIIGVNNAKKKKKKGLSSGVAGILISAINILIIIIGFFALNNYLRKAKTTPPDYTIVQHSSSIEETDEEIDRVIAKYIESTF